MSTDGNHRTEDFRTPRTFSIPNAGTSDQDNPDKLVEAIDVEVNTEHFERELRHENEPDEADQEEGCVLQNRKSVQKLDAVPSDESQGQDADEDT